MTAMLELRRVSKVYGSGPTEVQALREVDLSVRSGELVAVMGPSGSGKSTLLTIAGSLEEPTGGEVLGHAQSGRTRGERGSVVGRRYRHTTPEMAARAVAAVEARLDVVLAVAARLLPESDIPDNRA